MHIIKCKAVSEESSEKKKIREGEEEAPFASLILHMQSSLQEKKKYWK